MDAHAKAARLGKCSKTNGSPPWSTRDVRVMMSLETNGESRRVRKRQRVSVLQHRFDRTFWNQILTTTLSSAVSLQMAKGEDE
eukprot:1157645-Pelagomonas_calceolata.AAC.10